MTDLLLFRMNAQTSRRNTLADNVVPYAKLWNRHKLSAPEIDVSVHWEGASVWGAVVDTTDAPTKAMLRTNAAGPLTTSSIGHVRAQLHGEQRQALPGDARSSCCSDS